MVGLSLKEILNDKEYKKDLIQFLKKEYKIQYVEMMKKFNITKGEMDYLKSSSF